MRVTLKEHGGIAAAVARPPRTVDSATLPAGSAAELAGLVAAARAAAPAAPATTRRAPDAMSYAIDVEEDDGPPLLLRQSDLSMSPAFAALLEWLRRHGGRG